MSTKAQSCPKCGHAFSAGGINMSDPVHLAGVGVCVFLIVLTLVNIGVIKF